MSKQKTQSRILLIAERRLAGMVSIDPNLDLGQGRTVAAFRTMLERVKSQVAHYNAQIARLEGERNQVKAAESAMGEQNRDYLAAVGLHFGYDSTEFEQVGGKIRKKSRRSNPAKESQGSGTAPSPTAEPGTPQAPVA
jgi:phage shock protein A